MAGCLRSYQQGRGSVESSYGGAPETIDHSAFSTPLTGPIGDLAENTKVLQKFDIYYSTDPQGANLDSVVQAKLAPRDRGYAAGSSKHHDVGRCPHDQSSHEAGAGTRSRGNVCDYFKAPDPSDGYDLYWYRALSAVNSIAVAHSGGQFVESNNSRTT